MNDGAMVIPEGRGGALTAGDVRMQVNRVQEILKEVMIEDVHFGKIPGTDKPSLLKAGAEKLCMVFRLGPDYEIVDKERDGDHLSITSKCILTHIPTGQRIGSALGSCSSMESKYAYRKGVRKCPTCDAGAIMKSKYPPRDNPGASPGWWCNPKAGGCGGNFSAGDPSIESQEVGRIANEDKADVFNTVLKMSNKRALLAAVLNATAASDIFAQDLLEDTDHGNEMTPAGEDAQRRAKPEPRKVAEPKKKATAKEATVGNGVANHDAQPSPVAPPGKVTATQVRILSRKLADSGLELPAICEKFNVDSIENLPFAKFNDVSKFLEESAK